MAETRKCAKKRAQYYDVDVHNAIFPSPTFPSRAFSAFRNPRNPTARVGIASSPRSTIPNNARNIAPRAPSFFFRAKTYAALASSSESLFFFFSVAFRQARLLAPPREPEPSRGDVFENRSAGGHVRGRARHAPVRHHHAVLGERAGERRRGRAADAVQSQRDGRHFSQRVGGGARPEPPGGVPHHQGRAQRLQVPRVPFPGVVRLARAQRAHHRDAARRAHLDGGAADGARRRVQNDSLFSCVCFFFFSERARRVSRLKVRLEVRAQVREVLEQAECRGQVHAHLRRELVRQTRGDAPQRRRGEHRELAPRPRAGDVGDNLHRFSRYVFLRERV